MSSKVGEQELEGGEIPMSACAHACAISWHACIWRLFELRIRSNAAMRRKEGDSNMLAFSAEVVAQLLLQRTGVYACLCVQN